MAKTTTDDRAQRIVDSDAFKALNVLIDQSAEELAQYLLGFQDRLTDCFKHPSEIPVRVSYENEGRVSKPLPADPAALLQTFEHMLERIRLLKDRVNDLQRFKLRLLNDYDFTHGDDSEQRAVFANL